MQANNPLYIIRNILAYLYQTAADARRVMHDAGLDTRNVDFQGSAINIWHAVLGEAQRTDQLDALLAVASNAYPNYRQLDEAWQQYLQSPQQYRLESDADRSIRNACINPQSVIDRVNLENFSGRDWLLAKVDAFLAEHDRGYFILKASAGLGKTTFFAWLVRQRQYIHHFCEQTSGPEGVGTALRSLAAQLVLKYRLQSDGVLSRADTRPDYLYELLTLAAAQRADGEQIVLMIDALDEAGTPLNQNVLGLPALLPEGVYVIASQRPVMVTLRVEEPTTAYVICQLTAADERNKADMRSFLEHVTKRSPITDMLQKNGYRDVYFVSTLLDKSQGLWIYLHYVIKEIEKNQRPALDLELLPNGITSYYAEYWKRWREDDGDAWDECYLPILSTLAVSQQMVSGNQLLDWSGVEMSLKRLRRLLEEKWQSFLLVDESGSYRFYHRSLNEFFTLGTNAQDVFSRELLEATTHAHCRISDYYLQQWGGLEQGLPRLTPSIREPSNGQPYGLQHVVHHLLAGNQFGLLCQLVEHPQWQNAKPLLSVRSPSYIADLQQACQTALVLSDNPSNIKALRFLWQQALAHQALSPSADVIIFIAELGYWQWACDLTLMADNLLEQEQIWCGIARKMAGRCPDKAIEALGYLANHTEIEEIGRQCRYLCVAAQLVVELNLDFGKGKEFLSNALVKSRNLSQEMQKTFEQNWFLPTSAILGGLDEAHNVCEQLPLLEYIYGIYKILQAFSQLNHIHLPLVQKLIELTNQVDGENISESKISGLAMLAELQSGQERQHTLDKLELQMATAADSQTDSARLLIKTIQRVASYDVEWACKILNQNKWNHWRIDDAWPYVIEEMISVDIDRALQLTDEKLENWMAYGHVLTQIIGRIAQQNLKKAEQLLADKQQKLSFNYADAQVAIARAYMRQGDQQKAEKILFQRDVFFRQQINSTRRPTWLEKNQLELQINVLHVAASVLSTDLLIAWYDDLETKIAKWNDMEQEGNRSRQILIEALGHQGNLELLRPYLRSQDDYELAARSLARSNPATASHCIEEWNIGIDTEYGAAAHAYVALSLTNNMSKIDEFLDHYRNKHDFCYPMFHLPFILNELSKTERVGQELLADKLEYIWQVGTKMRCPSHFDSERQFVYEQRQSKAMGQTIVTMFHINPERAKKMLAQAKDSTLAINALIELASRRSLDLEFISEFKQQTCAAIEDNYERAAAYYKLALQLPDEQDDSAKGLIDEAESWFQQKPSYKHKLGIGNHPVRYEISESDLCLLKAQALTRFLRENFNEIAVNEIIELIDRAKAQDIKRRILLDLFVYTENWGILNRQRLFSYVTEKYTKGRMRDVLPLIAASIPVIYMDGGKQSLRSLWNEIKSAHCSVKNWLQA